MTLCWFALPSLSSVQSNVADIGMYSAVQIKKNHAILH